MKEKKPQFRVDAYEKVIDAMLINKFDALNNFITIKFKDKSVSTSTICDARLELFNLMIYIEDNVRFDSNLTKYIAKYMEHVTTDNNKVISKISE